jgi:hypothetical protein
MLQLQHSLRCSQLQLLHSQGLQLVLRCVLLAGLQQQLLLRELQLLRLELPLSLLLLVLLGRAGPAARLARTRTRRLQLKQAPLSQLQQLRPDCGQAVQHRLQVLCHLFWGVLQRCAARCV